MVFFLVSHPSHSAYCLNVWSEEKVVSIKTERVCDIKNSCATFCVIHGEGGKR